MESVKSRKCIKCGVIVPSTPLGMISHWKKYHNEPPKEVTDAELKRRKDFRTYFNKKVKENPKKYQLKEISVLPTTKLSKQVICKKVDNFLKDVSNSTFTDVISKTSEEKEGPQKKVVVKEEVHVPHFVCEQCGESLIGLMPAFAHFAQHGKQNNDAAKKTPQTEPKEPDAKNPVKKSFSEVKIKTEGAHGASSESAKTLKSAESCEKDDSAESIKVRLLSKEENQSITDASSGKTSKITEITVKNATWNIPTVDIATASKSTASTPSCHPAEIVSKPELHAKFSVILNQEEEKLQPSGKQVANNKNSEFCKPTSAVALKLPGTDKIVCKGPETVKVSSTGNEKSVISQSVRKTNETIGEKGRQVIQSQNTAPSKGEYSDPVVSSAGSIRASKTILNLKNNQRTLLKQNTIPTLKSFDLRNETSKPTYIKSADSALKITPSSGLKSLPNVPSGQRLEMGIVAKNTAKIGLRSENMTNIDNLDAEIAEIAKNGANIYEMHENTANMAKKAHTRQNFEKEKEVIAGPQRNVLKLRELVKQTAGLSENSRRTNKKLPEAHSDVDSGSVPDETILTTTDESLPSVPSAISPSIQPTVFHVPALTENSPLTKDMVEDTLKPSRPTTIPDHPESHPESDPASNTESTVDFASNNKGNAAVAKNIEKLLMQKPDTATIKAPVWKSKQQREKDAAAEKELSGEPNDDSTTLPSDMLVPLPTIIPPPKSNRIRSSYSAAKIVKRISSTQTVDKQQCDQSDAETINESSAAKQQKRKKPGKPQKSTPSYKTGKVSKNVRQRSRSHEASQKSQQKDTFQKKVSKKTRKSSHDDFQMFSSDRFNKFSNRSNIENSSEDSDWDLPDLHCDVERSSSSNIRNQDGALLETSNRRKDKHPRTRPTFHQKGRFDPDQLQAAVCLLRSDQAGVSQEASNHRNYDNCRRQTTFDRTTIEKDLRNSIHEEIEPAILNDSKKNVDRDVITISSDSDSDDETLGYGKAQWLAMRRQQEKSAEDNMDEKCDSNVKEFDTGTSPNNDGPNRSVQLLNRSSSDEPEMRVLSVKSLTSDVSQPDSSHSNESAASPQSTYRPKDTTGISDEDITGSSESSGEEIVSKSKKHKKTKHQASRKRKTTAIYSDADDPTFIPDHVNANKKSRKIRRRCNSKTSVKSGQNSCVVSGSDASSDDNISNSYALETASCPEIQEMRGKIPDCQENQPVSLQQKHDAAVLPTDGSLRDLNEVGDEMSFFSPAEHVKVCRRNTLMSGESKENNANKHKRKNKIIQQKRLIVSTSDSDNLRADTPHKTQPVSGMSKPGSVWDRIMWNSTRDDANESDSGDKYSDKSLLSSPLSQEDCDVTKSTSTHGKSSTKSDSIHEEGMTVAGVSKSSDVELESKCEDRYSDGAHERKGSNVETSTLRRFNSPAVEVSSCTASPDLIAAMESTTSSSQLTDTVPETSEEVLPKPTEQPRRRGTARKSIRKPSPPRSITIAKCEYCPTFLPENVQAISKHLINECEGIKRLQPSEPPEKN